MDEKKMKKLAAAYAKANAKKAKKLLSKAASEEEYLICALVYETKASDNYENIAVMAVRKIKDRDMLFTVATQARDYDTRLEIVKNSSDEDLLKAICAYPIRDNAATTGTQEWAHERLKELNEEKVDNITDENELANMILGLDPAPAYEEIMSKISSADRLIRIAAEAKQWYIRENAYRCLDFIDDDCAFTSEQEKALAEAIINEKDTNAECEICLGKIKDDNILGGIASKAKLKEVRVDAINAMKKADEAFLRKLLSSNKGKDFMETKCSYNDFLKAVLGKIETPELQFEFVKDKSFDDGFRLNCLTKIFETLTDSSAADMLCDEAVKILIDEGKVCGVCRAIPDKFHKKYGFTTREEKYDSEDQYGRFTSSHMYVTFEGKEYQAY